MYYPTLPAPKTQRDVVRVFRGYNHNPRIGAGEFYHMENLTSSAYPLLSPRPGRGFYTGGGAISGLMAKDQLCYTDGTALVVGTERVELDLTPGEKNLVSMGAYVVILPDKKYVNTVDPADRGSIEARFTSLGAVALTLCDSEGNAYTVSQVGGQEPLDVSQVKLWLDTSGTELKLKSYSTSSGAWVALETTYVKIAAQGIGKVFGEGDGVTLTGLKDQVLRDYVTGAELSDPAVSALDGSFVIRKKADNWILITGILSQNRTLSNRITVTRQMPDLDLCVESGNRLWGCRYGLGADGKTINEIYASKLGDFKNWNCFQGVSTDSYTASCGTDGPFTGAAAHLGYPLFFKEGCLHKVYGSYPANFRIQTTLCQGVQKGSGKSLAIVGQTLLYKSRLGVCGYDGSEPVDIGKNLGDVSYTNGVGGGHGSKYYLSMMDPAGAYHLFVYDLSRGLWHREDSTQARAFCSYGNDLYYLDGKDGRIKTILGTVARDERPVSWLAETGALGVEDPDKKYISRVQLRVQLSLNSTFRVSIDYDSRGQWQQVCTLRGAGLESFDIPIHPRRCDHFRLRLEGQGEAKLYSLSKTITEGGRR